MIDDVPSTKTKSVSTFSSFALTRFFICMRLLSIMIDTENDHDSTSYARLQKLKRMRWSMGRVPPPHILEKLSTHEKKFFKEYDRVVMKYMDDVYNGIALDVTAVRIQHEVACIQFNWEE